MIPESILGASPKALDGAVEIVHRPVDPAVDARRQALLGDAQPMAMALRGRGRREGEPS